MAFVKVGKIVHFFDKILVAVLAATDGEVKKGDEIMIGEEGVGFTQKVESMEVDHVSVDKLEVGKEAGLKVVQATKTGTVVYKVV